MRLGASWAHREVWTGAAAAAVTGLSARSSGPRAPFPQVPVASRGLDVCSLFILHSPGDILWHQAVAVTKKAAANIVCGFCVGISFQLPWANT